MYILSLSLPLLYLSECSGFLFSYPSIKIYSVMKAKLFYRASNFPDKSKLVFPFYL